MPNATKYRSRKAKVIINACGTVIFSKTLIHENEMWYFSLMFNVVSIASSYVGLLHILPTYPLEQLTITDTAAMQVTYKNA